MTKFRKPTAPEDPPIFSCTNPARTDNSCPGQPGTTWSWSHSWMAWMSIFTISPSLFFDFVHLIVLLLILHAVSYLEQPVHECSHSLRPPQLGPGSSVLPAFPTAWNKSSLMLLASQDSVALAETKNILIYLHITYFCHLITTHYAFHRVREKMNEHDNKHQLELLYAKADSGLNWLQFL